MKKILLTLLTALIISTGFVCTASAQTTNLTLDHLKNTLNMSDEEILSSGLAFVYATGDKVTINLTANSDIDAGRGDDGNFTISKGTKYAMEFEVANKSGDCITLISNNTLPVGLTSLAISTDADSSNYKTSWINTFLNEKVYSMFNNNLKSYVVDSQAEYNFYDLNDSGIRCDYTDQEYFTEENCMRKLFVPTFKQLGYGNTYKVDSTNNLNGIGETFTLYKTTAKTALLTDGTSSSTNPYWFADALRINNDNYYLASSVEGVVKKDALSTDYAGIIFGFSVTWSNDTLNGTTHKDDADLNNDAIEVTSYIPSTYTVSLPKSISLSNTGLTQFTYNVSGDIEENYKVYVTFDETAALKYQGTARLDDVTMNIFNQKVAYSRYNCLENNGDGFTSTVTIKNAVPKAGTWKGTLPITISLANS